MKIGQGFLSQWHNWKLGPNVLAGQQAYAVTQDLRRIFGFNELEINRAADERSMLLHVDGLVQKLTALGSGITQFLMVLVNVAIRKPAYILIDEPELNLHPTLQQEFLTILKSYVTHGILFSSHSIGLARVTADRRYSLLRVAQGHSQLHEYEGTPRLAEFLGELSFSGYREVGINKVLLAEGPNDIAAFKELLRIYGKEHEFLILPLGGGSLINGNAEEDLIEIKRITEKVTAVIDSDRERADALPKQSIRDFEEACKRAKVPCHILKRRTLENYFTDRAVQLIKGPQANALTPFQTLKEAGYPWGKSEDWRIAREMTREEPEQTDLGAVLAQI